MKILTSLFTLLLISITGCALLNQPLDELDSSQLTCETNPRLVDGDLETVSVLTVNGLVRKEYKIFEGGRNDPFREQRQYVTELEGTLRTEAVIKLDAPTYVSHIVLYPASRIPKLSLVTTTVDPPQFSVSFEAVRDKQHTDIESLKPIRFNIARKVLYLRIGANAIEDKKNSIRGENDAIEIPLKGAEIREIKFYVRKSDEPM